MTYSNESSGLEIKDDKGKSQIELEIEKLMNEFYLRHRIVKWKKVHSWLAQLYHLVRIINSIYLPYNGGNYRTWL